MGNPIFHVTMDTRYLDNRSKGEIMEERLHLLAQELSIIKTEFQERMDREFNQKVSIIEEKVKKEEAKRQESTNNLTLLLTDMEQRFQKILAEREAEIYSSLYHFRIFRWKIDESVGNTGGIDIPHFQLFLNESSGLRSRHVGSQTNYNLSFTPVQPKDFHISYSYLGAREQPLESSYKINIPWSPITVYFRFLQPIQLKLITYNENYIQNGGYTANGLPAKWVIEGSNDEKVWTLLSEGNHTASSSHIREHSKTIHLRTYKQI